MDFKPRTRIVLNKDSVEVVTGHIPGARGIVIQSSEVNDYQILVEFGDGERRWLNKGYLTEDGSVTDQTPNCPKCGAKWEDGDIYERLKQLHPEYSSNALLAEAINYGWSPECPVKFTRLVGVVERDILHHYQCPDCKENFPRGY